MFHQPRRRLLLLAGAAALLMAGSAAAQETRSEDRPRIERLRFEGVEALEGPVLRRSIVAEETRCRTVLMRPFCWLTDWDVFVEKHHLDRRELERDELRLEVLYFRRGHREAEVASDVRPHGGGVEVVFHVREGPPTIIEAVHVEQTEEVLRDRHLRRAGVPEAGDPLDLFQLDTARIRLREMFDERGYLDALIGDTAVVENAARTAVLEIFLDPGRRATLAELDISGNREISESTIRDATLLRRGRVLRRGDVEAAQRSLYESNLFHEASVSVPLQPDSAKVVEVQVREAPPRRARLGGGFNTVDFIQTEGRFVHYNWLGGGRRLDVNATVGNLFAAQLDGAGIFADLLPDHVTPEERRAFQRPTWQVSADVLQPSFRAAENTLGFGVFAQRRIVPGVVIDQGYGANISFTRRLRAGTGASLRYRYEITTVEAGDLYFCVNYGICDIATITALRERQRLSPLELSFNSDHSDDPLDPTTGWRARLDLEHASEYTASDFRYHRASTAGALYLSLGGRRVLAGRLRAGWVQPLGGPEDELIDEDAEARLHPRKRFYAGGSQSVRGYGENQLGPRILTIDPVTLVEHDPDCTLDAIEACDPGEVPSGEFVPRPLGGTARLEANVEYRFRLWRDVDMAVFVDAGAVRGRGGGLLGTGVAALTPGFGFRYHSPIGPIRGDLGIRPRITEVLPVVTQVLDEDGQPQIVLLPEPKRFDPLEDTGRGIFRQVLNRLTLHLSIGQAF